MKKCVNCKMDNRDNDTYCRNCGISIKSNKHYVLMNVFTVLAFIILIFVIILFVASYYVYK